MEQSKAENPTIILRSYRLEEAVVEAITKRAAEETIKNGGTTQVSVNDVVSNILKQGLGLMQ